MASLVAAPTTSFKNPQLVELVVMPWMTAVPVSTRLPLASGVPADGRMRRFCHVSEHVTPLLLADVTVKVRLVVLTVVIATEVPLATPLMFSEFAPLPLTRVISAVGCTAFVSKINPVGAFKTMVPAPTFPL